MLGFDFTSPNTKIL